MIVRPFWIFILCFNLFQLRAQTPATLPVTLITKSDGLSLADNRFIYKDTRGFTWISSAHGLHRFDGKNIKRYLPDSQDSSGMRGLIVNGLISEDHDKNIWFTTYDAVNCYVRSTGRFESYTVPGNDLPGYYACGLDSTGQLWLMFDEHLYVFDIHRHTFTREVTVKPGANRGQIQLDDEGNVSFVVTYNNDRSNPGFQIIDFRKPESPQARVYNGSDTENPIVVRGLYTQNDSTIWIASRTGLYLFNLNNASSSFYSPFPEGELANFNGIERLNDSLLIIVSYGKGAFTFHLNKYRFENQFQLVCNEQEVTEPPQAVYRDKEGGIWISVHGRGVAYFHPQNHFFKFYKHQLGTSLLTSGINLNSLIELPDKRIWGSSNLHGAVLLKDVQTVEKHFEREKTQGMPANNTKISLMDSQDRIWVITASGPILVNKDFTVVPIFPDSLVFFTSLCESQKGEMILGRYEGGLYRSIESADRSVYLDRIREVNPSKVYTLLYRHSNGLIYGAADLAFLDIYNPRENFNLVLSIPFRVNAQCMVPMNKDSEIWMGTDQGIFVYGITEGRFITPDWMTALKEMIVYGIIPYNDHIIWLSTNQGIYKLDTDKKSFENFDLHNGTGSINFNAQSFLHRSNGEIWLGSLDGITVIDPTMEMNEVPASHINITNILVNDEDSPWLSCSQTGATNITDLKSIDLAYKNNTLSFEFTAVDYAGPEHIIYAYRMKGVDENWIQSTHQGFARYANLNPGNYTFEVKAVNQNPGLQSPFRSIAININAPFYRKSWFTILSVVFISSLFVFFLRLFEKRKQKLRQLQFEKRIALETERLRIANDMHDDLGSGLSALSLRARMLSTQADHPQLQSQLNEFVNSAQHLAQQIRETIWTINSKNDTVDSLVTRLHQYALEYFGSTKIDCTIDLMQEQNTSFIPGSHRRELYLTYKEALHNVYKHSHATRISISLMMNDANQLVIEIKDNGIGFDPKIKSNGNGLESMSGRMQSIGGQFHIHSGKEGTHITLIYPV